MKKKHFDNLFLACLAFSVSLTANAQTGVCGTAMSNTAHTITLSNPSGMPAGSGICNITIKYLQKYLDPNLNLCGSLDGEGTNRVLTSTGVATFNSNSTQLVITDNTLTFPTLTNTPSPVFDFITTTGYIKITTATGIYFWRWNHGYLNCAPVSFGVCGSNMSNTEHTISFISGGLIPPGTYNLGIRYLDVFGGPPECDGYNASLSSIGTANVTQNAGGVITITDNTLSFPTDLTTFFNFSPDTKGYIQFSNGIKNYFWYWELDQYTCVALPVTFISFTAQLNPTNNSVTLNWQTSDEYDLDSYVIEKSSPLPGSCFVPIATIAPANTSGIHNYQYIDNAPYNNTSYYRLKSVDIDGKFKYYPAIRTITCTTCTANPPAVNCSQVSISGPSSVCNFDLFSLTGVASCGTATWSISPSGIGTIVPNYYNSLEAKVTRTGTGIATISATLPGCPYTFTKTINMGVPTLSTTSSVYKTQAYTRYLISIYNPTGTPSDYTWYSDGYFIGTGYSQYYYVYPGMTVNYSVSQYTSCGTTSFYGYLYYQTPGGGGGGCELPFTVKQSPSNKTIVVGRPPCWITPMLNENSVVKNSAVQADDYELRLMDFQGTIKADVNHVSLKNTYNFDVRNMLPGNYVMQILSNGVIQYSKKMWVE